MHATNIIRILLMLSLALTVSAAGEPESRSFRKAYSAESFNRIEFELPGDTALRIRTSTEPVIAIEGTIGMNFKESTPQIMRLETLEGISVVAEIDGRRLIVKERREGEAKTGPYRWVNAKLDVTITIPEWTNVEVRQRNGSVDVRGGLGSVSVGMRSGQIQVAVPKERVKELSARTRIGEVKADLGRVTEEREGILPGETHYENPQGTTRVELVVMVGDISVELMD